MLQRTLCALRLNKSTGYRWSAIPKPPPPQTDRLYGIHCVLNALRVFASGTSGGAVRGGGKERHEGETFENSEASTLVTTLMGNDHAPKNTKLEKQPQEATHGTFLHPHREFVNCLYIRDFSLESMQREGGKGDAKDTPPLPKTKKTIPAKYSALHRITALAKDADVPVRFVPRAELRQLCGERRNQNVVLEVGRYQPARTQDASRLLSEFFSPCTVPTAGSNAATKDGPGADELQQQQLVVALYLDHIIDPANVGSILRTSFFFGVDHVILSSDSASCTPAVARASTGFLEFMDIQQSTVPTPTFLSQTTDHFQKLLTEKRKEQRPAADVVDDAEFELEIVGSTTQRLKKVSHGEAERALPELTTKPKKVFRLVVLGNEDAGLPPSVIQQCSHLLHIRSPRQDMLQERDVQGCLNQSTAARDANGKLALSELQKREWMSSKLRRLRRNEISLNVNTACAALLSRLVVEEKDSSLVQMVKK